MKLTTLNFGLELWSSPQSGLYNCMKVASKLYFLGTRVLYYIDVYTELRQNAPCSRDLFP
jgi:hypothetical protein